MTKQTLGDGLHGETSGDEGESQLSRALELAKEVEALLAAAEDRLPPARAYEARLAKALASSLVEELDPDAHSERRPSVRVRAAVA